MQLEQSQHPLTPSTYAKPIPFSRIVGHKWQQALPLVTLALSIVAWEVTSRLSGLPVFILPRPVDVAQRFLSLVADGTLLRHLLVTLSEVLAGLAIGLGFASVVGYLLAKSRSLEKVVAPYLVASQAIPTVALAPLLIIWLGPGMASKVVIAALIVFFPVLMNVITGIRNISPEYYTLLRGFNATPWQIFAKLELPAALPVLLAGLKVGVTLSVIGAVVGEFAGADAGLGFMISLADGLFDTARVFVGVFTLIGMALSLYGLVALLEHRALRWRP